MTKQIKKYSDYGKRYYTNKINMARRLGVTTQSVNKYGFKLAVELYDKCGRKCTVCGDKHQLHIHHIDHNGRNNKEKGLPENNSLDNLTLMCIKCHGSYHSKLNWESNRKTTIDLTKVKSHSKEYDKLYYQEKKAEISIQQRKYKLKNKEKIRERDRIYWLKRKLNGNGKRKYKRSGDSERGV